MRTLTSSMILTIAAAISTGELRAATLAYAVPAQAQPEPADAIERGTKAIARAKAAYASLKSYSDSFEVVWDWKAEDHPAQKTVMKGTTVWATPNKLRLAGETSCVICDGSTLVLYDTGISRYVRQPQPAEGEAVQDVLAEDFPQVHWLMDPAAAILMRGDANPEMLLRMIKKVTSSEPHVRGGLPGLNVLADAMADPDDPTITTPTKVTLWLRDSDGLIGYFGLDTTDASNEHSGTVYESVLWSCELTDITTNAEIPADTFVFTPGPADEEVDSFEEAAVAQMPGGSQNQLIGSPAPALGAPDLDGKSVTIEEYRGRVVVLDFWATWCGPCVAAMPHVQKLSEQYADKPVTVLGINQDRGDTEKVQKFIADKKITFRQVMDEGDIGAGYLVQGIPCTVLIDKEGVVQDVHVGFSPGSEKELATKIDRLLEGKPIHTPEEIENFRKEAEREANRPALAFPAESAERLADAGRVGQGFFHRYQSKTIDIDGDGKPEVVTPTENALQYIDETGQAVKTIRLKGMDRGHVDSFHPVRIDGKTHWLITMMEFGRDPNDRSTAIAFFDETGKKLWTCRPKGPEQSFVQASLTSGDLTGDGIPELVIGLEATRLDDSGDLQFDPKGQAGAVLVLDREGNTLVQRAFKEQVNLVFVGVPTQAGEPAFVTVVTNHRVQKLKLDLNAKGEATKKDITP